MEQQHSVTMRHISGTSSLKIAGLLLLSPLLNQDLKHLFLPLLLTEAISNLELHCDFYSSLVPFRDFYFSLLVLKFVSKCFYLFLNAILNVFLMSFKLNVYAF